MTPSVRLRSEGRRRRRRRLPGLLPAPSRRRAPRALPPGPPFRAGASRPPRQAQRGPRVRHGENGSCALPPQQQQQQQQPPLPPPPRLLALDPGSRRLRRSPRRPAASAPAPRWSEGPRRPKRSVPRLDLPPPLHPGPAPVRASSTRRCLRGRTCSSSAGRPPSRGARRSTDPVRSTQPRPPRTQRIAGFSAVSLRSASLRDGGGAPRPPCVGGLLQLHKLARILVAASAGGCAQISSELLQIRHCSPAAYKLGSGISLQPGAIGVEVSAMNPVNATALYISASRLVLNYDPGDPKAFTEINRLLPYFRQSLSCCVCGETLLYCSPCPACFLKSRWQ